MKPGDTARYRQHYRQREISPRYCVRCHLLFTFGGGLSALLLMLAQLDGVQSLEWLTIPLALLYANMAEYVGHRFPMHRPFSGLSLIYKRHAGQHHRFFTNQHMPFDHATDLKAVLFPPLLVLFFFGGFGLPAWWLLSWSLSDNVAWLFLASGVAYYLNYELFHLAYHLPPQHPLARLGLIRRLRWLHAHHHNPAVMSQVNFNISYPLGDWLFGSLALAPVGLDLTSTSADGARPTAGLSSPSGSANCASASNSRASSLRASLDD